MPMHQNTIKMRKPVVLVTSATSHNGSYAAKLLLDTNKYIVRLGTRNPAVLQEFVAHGAEAVVLDSRVESIRRAFSGVHYVYIILPAMSGGGEHTMFKNFLQAAQENGVCKHVVYLSAIDAAFPAEKFATFHKHYEHEQMLVRGGEKLRSYPPRVHGGDGTLPFTILRPAWFHEHTIVQRAQSVKQTGEFYSSAGDGVWTSVAISDIAAVAVAVLKNPEKHINKTYTLTEEALTDGQLAEKIGRAIGLSGSVRHINLTPEEHAEFIKAHYAGPRPVEEVVAGMLVLDKNKRDSRFSEVRPDLELVLNRKGISLDEFLADHADAFQISYDFTNFP